MEVCLCTEVWNAFPDVRTDDPYSQASSDQNEMKWLSNILTTSFLAHCSPKMSELPHKRKRTDLATDVSSIPKRDNGFSFLEFYAGVGGWRMALDEALREAETSRIDHTVCLAALDHSDLCLQVYHHNFPAENRVKACRIEQIKTEQLTTEWQADGWFMSPPCQPHTRQHDNQEADLHDPRSASFLQLCKVLSELPEEALPTMICLENVVGFEESNSCRVWRQALSKRDYAVAHFHWNPTQVQLPNDRPRYFCLAVLRQKMNVPHPTLDGILSVETNFDKAPSIRTSLEVVGVKDESAAESPTRSDLPRLREFLDLSTDDTTAHVCVPDKLLQRNASWCFDIVTPESQRSACFTSGYGKFVKGTGSVLYTGRSNNNDKAKDNVSSAPRVDFTLQRPEDRQFDSDWSKSLEKGSLRYLSGIEIARLMGFDPRFQFPESCSPKQQWKLVGNSLNVRLAARLISLGWYLCGKLPFPVPTSVDNAKAPDNE